MGPAGGRNYGHDLLWPVYRAAESWSKAGVRADASEWRNLAAQARVGKRLRPPGTAEEDLYAAGIGLEQLPQVPGGIEGGGYAVGSCRYGRWPLNSSAG